MISENPQIWNSMLISENFVIWILYWRNPVSEYRINIFSKLFSAIEFWLKFWDDFLLAGVNSARRRVRGAQALDLGAQALNLGPMRIRFRGFWKFRIWRWIWKIETQTKIILSSNRTDFSNAKSHYLANFPWFRAWILGNRCWFIEFCKNPKVSCPFLCQILIWNLISLSFGSIG